LVYLKKEIAALDPKLKGDFTKLFLEVKFSFTDLSALKTLGPLSVITFRNLGDYLFKFLFLFSALFLLMKDFVGSINLPLKFN
jgi:hypothetical protein